MNNNSREILEELINNLAKLRVDLEILERKIDEYARVSGYVPQKSDIEIIDFSGEDINVRDEDMPEPVAVPQNEVTILSGEVPSDDDLPSDLLDTESSSSDELDGFVPLAETEESQEFQEPEDSACQEVEFVEDDMPEINEEVEEDSVEEDIPEFNDETEEEELNLGSGLFGGEEDSLFEEIEAVPQANPQPVAKPRKSINEANSVNASGAVIDIKLGSLAWMKDIPGTEVKDIRSAISLNDRAMFISSLFKGDFSLFQETVAHINVMTDLNEAVEYVRNSFPEWKMDSDIVYRFMMAVRRKLRG